MTSFAGQANPPEPTRVDIAVSQYKAAIRSDHRRDDEWSKLNRYLRGFSHEECVEYGKRTGVDLEVVSVK
jgi:hypothetical protein